jgi:hypothetical protein
VVHYLVRSRLECVMADRVDPALRELKGDRRWGGGGLRWKRGGKVGRPELNSCGVARKEWTVWLSCPE